jgi:hypothetical protein
MRVHSFYSRDGRWAYTRNHRGENLPEEFGPWRALKILKLQAGADDPAIRSIGEKGFYVSESPVA